MIEETKYCKKCHKDRNINEFSPNKRKPTKISIICNHCKEINTKYYNANKNLICKFHRNKTTIKEEKKEVKPYVNCTYENLSDYVDIVWIETELFWNDFKCPKCKNRMKYDRTNISSTVSIVQIDPNLPKLKSNCTICCTRCTTKEKLAAIRALRNLDDSN